MQKEITSTSAVFFLPSILFGLLFILSSCNSPEVINDLSDASFPLVDQDSISVDFPQDYKGKFLVVGFIYTHCPDVCGIITANMSNISNQISDPDVHFVEITFDPKRDTPRVLKQYLQNYRLNEEKFSLLTGEPSVIDSLLSRMDIHAQISYTTTTDDGEELYFMNHTNRILIMDKEGRVRMEYPGSVVPPEIIIEDIQNLR